MKYYRRMTFRKRGRFSNRFTFRAVRQIGINDEWMEITIGNNEYRYSLDKLKLEILERYKSMETEYSDSWLRQRLVTIIAPERKFTLDMSNLYPDLEQSKELLEIFKDKIPFNLKSIPKSKAVMKENLLVALLVFLFVCTYFVS